MYEGDILKHKAKSFLIVLVAVTISATCFVGLAESSENNNTGFYDVLWEHTFPSKINDVQVSGNDLFIAADKLYVFDVYSKELLWEKEGYFNSFSVHEGIIFASRTQKKGDTCLTGVYADTGKAVGWSYDHAQNDIYRNIIPFQDKVLLITNDLTSSRNIPNISTLYVFDGKDVRPSWSWKNKTQILGEVAVYDAGIFTVKSDDANVKNIYCFSFNSSDYYPEPLWIRTFEDSKYFASESDNKSLYISDGNEIFSLSPLTNKINWFVKKNDVNHIKCYNNTVYGSSSDRLYSFDSLTGALNWDIRINDTYKAFNFKRLRFEERNSNIVDFYLGNEAIYVSTYQSINKIDSNGDIEWSDKIEKISLPKSIANGTVFLETKPDQCLHSAPEYIDIRNSANGTIIKRFKVDNVINIQNIEFNKIDDVRIGSYGNKIIVFSPTKNTVEENLTIINESTNSFISFLNNKNIFEYVVPSISNTAIDFIRYFNLLLSVTLFLAALVLILSLYKVSLNSKFHVVVLDFTGPIFLLITLFGVANYIFTFKMNYGFESVYLFCLMSFGCYMYMSNLSKLEIHNSYQHILEIFAYIICIISIVLLLHWYLLKAMASGVISSDLVFYFWKSAILQYIEIVEYSWIILVIIFIMILFVLSNIVKYIPIFSLLKSASKAEKEGNYAEYASILSEFTQKIKQSRFLSSKTFNLLSYENEELYLQAAKIFYNIGDYDKCQAYISKLDGFISNDGSMNIYNTVLDIDRLISKNNTLAEVNVNSSAVNKYFDLKRVLSEHYKLKWIQIEHIIIAFLILFYILYIYKCLSFISSTLFSDYSESYTLFILLLFGFLFVFGFIVVLLTLINIEKEQSLLFKLLNLQIIEINSEDEVKFKNIFSKMAISSVFICLLFSMQFSYWCYFKWYPLSEKTLSISFYFMSLLALLYSFLVIPFIVKYFISLDKKMNDLFGNESKLLFSIIPIIFMLLTYNLVYALQNIEGTFFLYIEGLQINLERVLYQTILIASLFMLTTIYFRKKLSLYFDYLNGSYQYLNKDFYEAHRSYSNIYSYSNSKLNMLIFPVSEHFLMKFYISYAKADKNIGRKQEAIQLLNLALQKAQQRRPRSSLIEIYYELGKIYESDSKLKKAYDNYSKAIDIIEEIRDHVQVSERREQFFDDKVEVYSSIVLVCLKMDMEEKAFEFAEKAKSRVFLDMLASERIKIKSNPELKEKEKEILLKIKNIESKMKKNRGHTALAEKINELFVDYDKLLLEIKEDDPDYYALKKSHVLNIHDIQNYLEENEVLLEFFVGKECKGFLITSRTFDVVNLSIDRDSLVENVKILREQIEMRGDIMNVSKKVYINLIKDLEPFLKGKELIIVPHGILHYLPFNALFDGNKWLIEKYDIRFLQSASMVQFLDGKHVTLNTALVVGDPTGELDSAKMEAVRIAEKFNTFPLSGSDATKEAVLNNIENKEIVHFACHGIFESDAPKFSRLALADGNLYVNDIYNLDINAGLVTLSACQTALGSLTNGDEVEGMTRAFMRAGSPSVISSLWSVDDQSTEILFSNFYELEGNKTKRLRDAQLRLMKEYGHPFYWAPFVLFGEK